MSSNQYQNMLMNSVGSMIQDNEDQVEEEHNEEKMNEERDVTDIEPDNEPEKLIHLGTHVETETPDTPAEKPARPKRGLPKMFLENQMKHEEYMEKQRRMAEMNKKASQKTSGSKADSSKSSSKTKNKNVVSTPVAPIVTTARDPGTRRVIVGGKVKYIPIKSAEVAQETVATPATASAQPVKTVNTFKLDISSRVDKLLMEEENEEAIGAEIIQSKKIPAGLMKKMQQHQKTKEALIQNKPSKDSGSKSNRTGSGSKSGSKSHQFGSKSGSTGRTPSKYAKYIENEVKKQTIRNVRTFTDLRKIKEMQNLDINMDPNKVSIHELRKLSLEKRKKDAKEKKKLAEANKKESAVQAILSDDKMNKFSKMVRIKNLSVNSRRTKPVAKSAVAKLNNL